MIHPSTFLSRALLADAVFSGVSAVGLTLGAGMLAPFLNLPEALLWETGLFLIAYSALVGWLASRSSVPKGLVLLVIVGNAAWTLGSIALLFSGAVSPNLLGQLVTVAQAIATGVFCGAAVYWPAQERWRGDGVSHSRLSHTRQRQTRSVCAREQSDEAIHASTSGRGLLRFGRNDGEYPQLKTNAAIIPAKVSTSPMTSTGTRLLPEYGSAYSLLVTTCARLAITLLLPGCVEIVPRCRA